MNRCLHIGVAVLMLLGCDSRKSKCEKARDVWVSDSQKAGQEALKLATPKDQALIRESQKQELAIGERAYVSICEKHPELDANCLAKGPSKSKGDAKCESALRVMDDELTKVIQDAVNSEPAAADQAEASATNAPAHRDVATLDWEKVPRWSLALQFDATGGAVYEDSCPEVAPLEAKVSEASDEFERKDRERAVKKAKEECVQRAKAEARKLPDLARVDFNVAIDGEYNFDENRFRLKLVVPDDRNPPAGSVRESEQADVGGNVLTLMISTIDERPERKWRMRYTSGIVVAPAKVGYFPVGKNTFYLPVASPDRAKQVKTLMKKGAVGQLIIEPGDPAKGTGIAKRSSDPLKNMLNGGDEVYGVRARPIALRFQVGTETVVGPFDLQE